MRVRPPAMLFFLPVRTHAYSERPPVGTLLLIAANVVVFLAVRAEVLQAEDLVLRWGEVTPFAWLTSNFVHAGWMHLIGNMIVLWAVGQVVEGTVGPWRFASVALLIGALECALEQVVFLGADEGVSFGASSMIYGLLVTAVVWAPRSTVDTVTFLLFRFRWIELSIGGLAAIMVTFEVLYAAVGHFAPSSAMLHLAGAAVGLPVALVFLRLELVDCGGWDWFSVRARKPGGLS